uniref:Uncharacterized protein n=1 Tax=Dermonema virens TaxID=1077399 RepID=A0A1G4NRP9_9FLOR|nr:Hypothetical protein ORF_5 [Dermonema virens]SCW21333.1 Hypothetical protein ORF_5 [Dermonema virens]
MKSSFILKHTQYLVYLKDQYVRKIRQHNIVFIALYTISLPFFPLSFLAVQHFILIMVFTRIFKKYSSFYYNWRFTIIIGYLSYFIFTILVSNVSTITFCLPYQFVIHRSLVTVSNKLLNTANQFAISHINCVLTIKLPILLTRTFLILLNYFTLYRIFLLSTPLDTVILSCIKLARNFANTHMYQHDSFLIILLSSELIYLLQLRIYQSIVALKLRGLIKPPTLIHLFAMFNLFILQYQKIFIKITINTISTIYSRDLLRYKYHWWFTD